MEKNLFYTSNSNDNIGYFTPIFNERNFAYNKNLLSPSQNPYIGKQSLGDGNDIYYVDTYYNPKNRVLNFESPNGGNDTVRSFVDYTLPQN